MTETALTCWEYRWYRAQAGLPRCAGWCTTRAQYHPVHHPGVHHSSYHASTDGQRYPHVQQEEQSGQSYLGVLGEQEYPGQSYLGVLERKCSQGRVTWVSLEEESWLFLGYSEGTNSASQNPLFAIFLLRDLSPSCQIPSLS